MLNNNTWEEIWQPIHFDFEYTNDILLEISNWGRVRSTNKVSKERILKGSMIEGYRLIKLKFFKPRTQDKIEFIEKCKGEIASLYQQKKVLLNQNDSIANIQKIEQEIQILKKRLSNILAVDLKARTINAHFLVHRMVAQHFLPLPKESEIIVGHLDYNKLNNKVDNLKWMTQEENAKHQQGSPNVIAEKQKRLIEKRIINQGHKLTSTQVIHIKLLLKKGKGPKELAKKFKVSEMQIWRIKSGENWSHVTIPE